MDNRQKTAVENYASHVRETYPEAIGVAFLLFECGCVQGGPFDANGDQTAPVTHIGQLMDGEIELCEECRSDGGALDRVSKPFLLFFQPCTLGKQERDWIGAKIFCESVSGD